MTLGEIGQIYGGLTGKSKSDFDRGDSKYVPYKNVYENLIVDMARLSCVAVGAEESQNMVKSGDMLFTASSETPEDCGMCSLVRQEPDAPLYLNSFCFGLRFNEDAGINPEYAKHLFRSKKTRSDINLSASGVTRFNISKKRFLRIKIPLPGFEEQALIAEILDKFDTLVNDISQGLPAEIEARRKQYAYYRDKLLAFKEKVA